MPITPCTFCSKDTGNSLLLWCSNCDIAITQQFGHTLKNIINAFGGNIPATGATMPPPSRSRWSGNSTKQKEARLIYEPALAGYSLKFTFDRGLVDFIKKVIPSHKRTTSGPPDWVWYFPSEYYPIVKTMFEGHKEFKLTIVTEEEVLKKQQEQEEASRHVWAPQQYSVEDELRKFENLLYPVTGLERTQFDFSKEIREWSKQQATKIYRKAAMFYHPDRNNGDGTKMSELNAVWAILKEGYYIK